MARIFRSFPVYRPMRTPVLTAASTQVFTRSIIQMTHRRPRGVFHMTLTRPVIGAAVVITGRRRFATSV